MSEIEAIRHHQPYSDGIILLRPVTEYDKESYYQLLGNLHESTKQILWHSALSSKDIVTFAVQPIQTGIMIGTGSISARTAGWLELGYEIIDEWQGRGFGSRTFTSLIKIVSSISTDKDIIARVRADNFVSIHIIEQNGGVKIDEEPSYYEEVLSRTVADFLTQHNVELDHVRTLVYKFDHIGQRSHREGK